MYLKNTAMMIAGRFKRKATSPPSIDARFHSSSCLPSLLMNGETCKKETSKEVRNPTERQTTLLKKQTRRYEKEKENASK